MAENAVKLGMSLDDIINRSNVRRTGRNSSPTDMQIDRRNSGVRKQSPRSGSRADRQSQQRQKRSEKSWEEDESQQRIDEGVAAGDLIKVSGESNTKKVAGKIAHASRSGSPPAMLCKGSASLNQAVKAVAVARKYLQEEGSDLTCQPAFRDDKQQASLVLFLTKRRPVTFPTRDVFELTAGSNSDPHKMAGALAARVREKTAVCLTGIGEEAVARCIRAICHTRQYLEEDNADISALVEFVTVEKRDDSLNAVRFNIVDTDPSTSASWSTHRTDITGEGAGS